MHEPSSPDTRGVPDPDAHARLRKAFDVLCAMSADARDAWLQAHPDLDDAGRTQLRRWLAADEAEGWLETPLGEHAGRIGDPAGVDDAAYIGRSIAGFRLLRVLGSGGMATVFLGVRERDGYRQPAAIKLLRRGLFSDVEQRLFRREQRALAALSHHGIARLIDGGITEAGIPYLVMEHVDGVPVTRFAADRRLDVAGRLRLFIEICAAAAAAHQRLIVHRDIKPSNIMFRRGGTNQPRGIMLMDFGIAKFLGDTGTLTGSDAVGTIDYMAPEQIMDSTTVDYRADIYALGVVLYETLTGVLPFKGNLAQVLFAHVNQPAPDIRQIRPDMPLAVSIALQRALQKDPNDRFQTAIEFIDMLTSEI